MTNIANVATSHNQGITLTADNAKKFAARLKTTLKSENIEFKTSKCYDILAQTFGSSNWHELSKHLSTEKASITKPILVEKNPKEMSNICDLNWIEFQFLVSEMGKSLGLNGITTEIINALLEVLKDRKYSDEKSYLNNEYVNVLLNDFDFYNWLTDQGYPLKYYLKINANLNEQLQKQVDKTFIKFFPSSSNGISRSAIGQIQGSEIVKLIEMIVFISKNNFMIKEPNHSLENNDVVQIIPYDNAAGCSTTSEYPFVSYMINLADHITQIEKLSFHDLLICLFLKRNTIKNLDQTKELIYYINNIIKPLFENSKFCCYLFNKINNNVVNEYKIFHSLFNLMKVELNYLPPTHKLILEILKMYKKVVSEDKIILEINISSKINIKPNKEVLKILFKKNMIKHIEFINDWLESVEKSEPLSNQFIEMLKEAEVVVI